MIVGDRAGAHKERIAWKLVVRFVFRRSNESSRTEAQSFDLPRRRTGENVERNATTSISTNTTVVR